MPIPAEQGQRPSDDEQIAFFEADQVDPAIQDVRPGSAHPFGQARLTWAPSYPAIEGYVDCWAFYEGMDFATAYAYTEWNEAEARDAFWGIGSDDAIRVWLNGKLVHEFKGGRAYSADEDLISVELQKGLNRVLVKIQNLEYDWGFGIREMEAGDFGELLVKAAGRGDQKAVDRCLGQGADKNYRSVDGLSAWQAARIKGREALCTYLVSIGADTTLPFPAPEKLADRYLGKGIPGTAPGYSVLVSQNGDILYHRGFGVADIGTGELLKPNSTFRIGSVTKQFTAVAILLLVQDGSLSLEDKLSAFYPGIAYADQISIRHMLNHTSGIHSYTEEPSFESSVTRYVDPAVIEQQIEKYDPDFMPGEAWLYSNSGYFLLGRIVEKISGKSLGQFWQERLFTPLEMKSSSLYDNRLRIARPDEAKGHSWEKDHYERALDWDMSWAAGAGAILSTPEDLFRWNEAVFQGRVLNEALLREAFAPAKLRSGATADAMGSRYGMGWMMDRYRGLDVISHTGGLHGFSSFLMRVPEQNITIVVLRNALPFEGPEPGAMGRQLAEYFFYEVMEAQNPQVEAEIDPEMLKDYVGRYAYPGGMVMVVRVEGDHLMAQLTGQPEHPLYPAGEDAFFWKIVEAGITFTRDASGTVTGGTHSQGGRSFTVSRMPDLASVTVDPAVLARYAGSYDLRGSEVVVEARGDKLFLKIAGQPELELVAQSEKEFALKVVDATVTFITDAAGNAIQLHLVQSGAHMEAPRKP